MLHVILYRCTIMCNHSVTTRRLEGMSITVSSTKSWFRILARFRLRDRSPLTMLYARWICMLMPNARIVVFQYLRYYKHTNTIVNRDRFRGQKLPGRPPIRVRKLGFISIWVWSEPIFYWSDHSLGYSPARAVLSKQNCPIQSHSAVIVWPD